MHRSEPFLKMSLLILLFLGLAEACTPREVATKEKTSQVAGIIGLMSRLSPDGLRHNITSLKMPPLVSPQDRTEEEIKKILGLLSLQVLHEETSGCKEEVKPFSGTTPSRKPLPKRKNTWNFLKCAYMVMTYLFVSYNKGDWCYCHYCNLELDIRDDPCCSF
ncbi:epididymal protein 13 [Pan paniscus]|uniref:epididymal protein 13 isoform X1 n=1 Tax=Homo sapiens TaxID=9606 RepID=UPI000D0A4D80|nr:epididymal protein 13 [Pan paniscus]XP_016792417.2 epididymal protein 13 [Pan troglodytes]XP_054175454.1 epididymal protein 13 isoform X1 [Homo sapiens]